MISHSLSIVFLALGLLSTIVWKNPSYLPSVNRCGVSL